MLLPIVEICTFVLYVSSVVTSADNDTSSSTLPAVRTTAKTTEVTEAVLNPVSVPSLESLAIPSQNKGVEKNKYFVRFTNAKDGQVITLDGSQPTPGLNVTSTFWNNSDSQKWLLLERGDVYLILPKRQHKEWANFLARTTQRGNDNLPSVTVVLGIDVRNAGITQQVLHGLSNQHWTFKASKEGRVLISSPARGKCIGGKMAVEPTKPSLIQRAASKIKGLVGSSSSSKNTPDKIEPLELVATDCDENDLTQLWRLEPITV